MSEQGAGAVVEPAAGEGGAAAPATPDIGGILDEKLGAFQTTFEQRFKGLEDRIPAPAVEEPAEEEVDFDALLDEVLGDEDFDQETGQATRDGQIKLIRELARREAQAALAPEIENREQERRVAEADALEEKYPELTDEKVQDAMFGRMAELAKSLGQPGLTKEPRFLEMVYLSEKARQSGETEVPADQQGGVHLERSGGGGPVQAQTGEDDGDRIVKLAGQKFRL
jgi:hypothetical protein